LRTVRADALLASGKTTEAEADYQQACAWSRERNAKWRELYSSIRIARLWRSKGRSRAARELLAPIYGWFTEGFDNAVLKEAGTLLEELV
jgi:predicted ATPase